jgi:hypothetical protein
MYSSMDGALAACIWLQRQKPGLLLILTPSCVTPGGEGSHSQCDCVRLGVWAPDNLTGQVLFSCHQDPPVIPLLRRLSQGIMV